MEIVRVANGNQTLLEKFGKRKMSKNAYSVRWNYNIVDTEQRNVREVETGQKSHRILIVIKLEIFTAGKK